MYKICVYRYDDNNVHINEHCIYIGAGSGFNIKTALIGAGGVIGGGLLIMPPSIALIIAVVSFIRKRRRSNIKCMYVYTRHA